MRRALRYGFAHIGPQGLVNRAMTRHTFLHGDGAQTIDNFQPDYGMAIKADHLAPEDKANRCPGDAAVSWKWESRWVNSPNQKKRDEFEQVLSQVNFYMKQHQTRYGFVCTDRELVPIQTLDHHGNLQPGPFIPWTASNIVEPHQPGFHQDHLTYLHNLTPLLALWYLGMLAARHDVHGYYLNP